jgi:tyrosinase
MYLYGSNNRDTYITENDDAGPGTRNARIERNLAPGTYYLRVKHYSPQATGDYRISVRVQDGGGSLPIIQVNGPAVQGNIAAPNENDFYTFKAEGVGVYTIETAVATDTVVTLFGPNSQTSLIAETDDIGPTNRNSRISANLAAGDYYVRVRHYSPARTGTYSISVRR